MIVQRVSRLLGDYSSIDLGRKLAQNRICRPATFLGLARRAGIEVALYDDGSVSFVWWKDGTGPDGNFLNSWLMHTPGGMNSLREHLSRRQQKQREAA